MKAYQVLFATVLGLFAAPTFAALTIDTATLVADIGLVQVAVLAIGAAVVTVILGIKAYKWLGRAM